MNKNRVLRCKVDTRQAARAPHHLFRMCRLWYGSNDCILLWKYFEVQLFTHFLAFARMTAANGTRHNGRYLSNWLSYYILCIGYGSNKGGMMDYSMSTKFSIKLRGICGELSRIPKVSEEKMFRTFSSGYPKNSFTNIKILPLLVSKKLK